MVKDNFQEEITEIRDELDRVKERNKELEKEKKKLAHRVKQLEHAGESQNSTNKDQLSRRQFLKMAGLGVGAISLSSATSAGL